MVDTFSGPKGLRVGSTRPSSRSKKPRSKSRKLTSHTWSSTSRIPTISPAKARLRLIFRLPRQMRPAAPYEAVAIQHGVHRADRRRPDHRELAEQLLADLGSPPGGVLLLDPEDRPLDLEGQLVRVTIGSTRAVVEPLEATGLVPLIDLVASDSGDSELAAQRGHLLALEEPGNESEALVHRFTRSPRHSGAPQNAGCVNHVPGMKRQPCLAKLRLAHVLRREGQRCSSERDGRQAAAGYPTHPLGSDDDFEPWTELNQPASGLPALIANCAAKARLYAGRASPRAT